MTDFRIVPSVEPTDKYQKAKIDIIEAVKSFGELNQTQKNALLNEFFTAESIAIAKECFSKMTLRR